MPLITVSANVLHTESVAISRINSQGSVCIIALCHECNFCISILIHGGNYDFMNICLFCVWDHFHFIQVSGHAIVQVVRCLPFNTEPQVRSRETSFVIHGGRSGIEKVSVYVSSGFPC